MEQECRQRQKLSLEFASATWHKGRSIKTSEREQAYFRRLCNSRLLIESGTMVPAAAVDRRSGCSPVKALLEDACEIATAKLAGLLSLPSLSAQGDLSDSRLSSNY